MATAKPRKRAEPRKRDRRIEIRTTEGERELIVKAVASSGTDLTEFVIRSATDAARRLLANRTHFVLSPEEEARWEAINAAPARDLPGLRRLMDRPSPFTKPV